MNDLITLLPLITVFVIFYALLYIPQRRRNKKHKNRKLMKEIEKLEHKIAKTDDIRNTIYNKIISMPDIEIRDIAFSLDNKLKKELKFHGRKSQYLYRRRRR